MAGSANLELSFFYRPMLRPGLGVVKPAGASWVSRATPCLACWLLCCFVLYIAGSNATPVQRDRVLSAASLSFDPTPNSDAGAGFIHLRLKFPWTSPADNAKASSAEWVEQTSLAVAAAVATFSDGLHVGKAKVSKWAKRDVVPLGGESSGQPAKADTAASAASWLSVVYMPGGHLSLYSWPFSPVSQRRDTVDNEAQLEHSATGTASRVGVDVNILIDMGNAIHAFGAAKQALALALDRPLSNFAAKTVEKGGSSNVRSIDGILGTICVEPLNPYSAHVSIGYGADHIPLCADEFELGQRDKDAASSAAPPPPSTASQLAGSGSNWNAATGLTPQPSDGPAPADLESSPHAPGSGNAVEPPVQSPTAAAAPLPGENEDEGDGCLDKDDVRSIQASFKEHGVVCIRDALPKAVHAAAEKETRARPEPAHDNRNTGNRDRKTQCLQGPEDPLWPLIYDGQMQALVSMATKGQYKIALERDDQVERATWQAEFARRQANRGGDNNLGSAPQGRYYQSEYRIYPAHTRGMPWHSDFVMYDPPQIEAVYTVHNDDPRHRVEWMNHRGYEFSVQPKPNYLMIVVAGGPMHRASALAGGSRGLIKFVAPKHGCEPNAEYGPERKSQKQQCIRGHQARLKELAASGATSKAAR